MCDFLKYEEGLSWFNWLGTWLYSMLPSSAGFNSRKRRFASESEFYKFRYLFPYLPVNSKFIIQYVYPLLVYRCISRIYTLYLLDIHLRNRWSCQVNDPKLLVYMWKISVIFYKSPMDDSTCDLTYFERHILKIRPTNFDSLCKI